MKRYRPNVCTVLLHAETGRVLVFRRAGRNLGGDAWQFPQGGVQPGETPREALLRELEEEIGTSRVTLLVEAPGLVRYEFPPDVFKRLTSEGRNPEGYVGQEQTWFLANLLDGEASIHFRNEPREFDAFRWVTPQEALAGAVPFKTEAYRQGLRALGLLPDL